MSEIYSGSWPGGKLRGIAFCSLSDFCKEIEYCERQKDKLKMRNKKPQKGSKIQFLITCISNAFCNSLNTCSQLPKPIL